MLLRYLAASTAAAVSTLVLFLAMAALIHTEGGVEEDKGAPRLIDFVRLRRESELNVKERRLPEKARPPEPPPPLPDLKLAAAARPNQAPQALAPAIDFGLDLRGGPTLAAAVRDTDIVPLVRVNPQYPLSALERGIEGWVEVEFTITPQGTVKDPVVVDSDPRWIFDRAALRAIRKWKYRPKIVDGVPVERKGVRVRLNFQIEN